MFLLFKYFLVNYKFLIFIFRGKEVLLKKEY